MQPPPPGRRSETCIYAPANSFGGLTLHVCFPTWLLFFENLSQGYYYYYLPPGEFTRYNPYNQVRFRKYTDDSINFGPKASHMNSHLNFFAQISIFNLFRLHFSIFLSILLWKGCDDASMAIWTKTPSAGMNTFSWTLVFRRPLYPAPRFHWFSTCTVFTRLILFFFLNHIFLPVKNTHFFLHTSIFQTPFAPPPFGPHSASTPHQHPFQLPFLVTPLPPRLSHPSFWDRQTFFLIFFRSPNTFTTSF